MRKKPIDPDAGRRLSEVREHRKISQRELAKAIAVKVGTIQGYEHARISISSTRLEQLAHGLQCEPADLVMSPGSPLSRYATRTPLVRTTAIEPVRLGFYGRPAHTTVAFEADAHTKAVCGVPADAPNELAWQRWYNRIHADDHARVNVELARLNNPHDGVFNMQYRLLGLDGIERCIIDYGCMIFDSKGEPLRLRGLMLDITAQPRAKMTDDKVRAIVAAISQDQQWKGLETATLISDAAAADVIATTHSRS